MSILETAKNILGNIAPIIATALGGPLAGAAVKTLTETLGLPEGASESEVFRIIGKATPEQLAAIKSADYKFETRMKELDIDVMKVDSSDRADARARQIAMKDSTPIILGGFVVIGFFGSLAYMMQSPIPEGSREVAYVMIGSLGTMTTAVVNYFFGSSSGSSKKNNIIQSLKK